jgi:hypothetical protein
VEWDEVSPLYYGNDLSYERACRLYTFEGLRNFRKYPLQDLAVVWQHRRCSTKEIDPPSNPWSRANRLEWTKRCAEELLDKHTLEIWQAKHDWKRRVADSDNEVAAAGEGTVAETQ